MEQSKRVSKSTLAITLLVSLLLIVALLGYRQFIDTKALKKSHWQQLRMVERVTADETAMNIRLSASKELREGLIRVIMDFQPKLDGKIAEKIVLYILEEAPRNGIDPILIAAIMWVESRFDPFAKSNKDAIGLMQIRYKVWKKEPALLENGARKEGSLYWIDINIKSGIAIFSEYYEHAEFNVVKTLHRYNTGSTKLPKGKRYYEIPYVNKVLISAYRIRDALTK
ncbi:hypothetical protein LCGC14_0682550 [marine sediment metagenome]|uniref:Transglycosylase SLT domain-containing protein n=1 Tax=marine sediment metagenome TaxID=412755 RepID=A0A0F9T981_9ZZZZ